jgi:phosphinothricin acetyltransferase
MIRLATKADIPAILEIYAPYVLETGYSFEYTVPTVEAFTQRFSHHTSYCPWLVWEEEGAVLGYAYGAPAFERAAYQWCAEVSIYLAPQAQRRGIGKMLYNVLEHIIFKQGYEVIYSIITSENQPSIDFHMALGYTKCAEFPNCGVKFGRRLGTVWLEKRIQPAKTPDAPPSNYRTIVDSDKKLKNILDNLSLS